MYNILLIFPFCSGGKSWRQRALIAIVNVVLMDQRLEPGDFDPFCSRTMDNDDIRLLTVVISGLIEFDEDNSLVSILLLQVWQPCLHLWRPGQSLFTRSSFTFTCTFSFTFIFTCGGLVSSCPPGHLSVKKLFHAEEVHYWYHWLHLVKCICFFVPELQMDSIIIDKRLTGVPWKCPDCGSERCPESFEFEFNW